MRTTTAALTVAEYSTRMARALRTVGAAVIEGEVQKPKTSASGMLWFALTDGDAALSCKVWARERRRLEHDPCDGDLVQVTVERPDIWRQSGKLDLIVSNVRLAGEGELLRRRQQLIAQLTAEGLCDPRRRRPLPRFPRAVGVISGAGSSGLGDFLGALQDRWPAVHIVTCPALVQGKRAPRDLIEALISLRSHPLVDVIVMGRGGGSVRDLAAFDDERLCRAIFACETPVVCAVGHTEDDSVCAHVTWSAPTPSRAPELVVPSQVEVRGVVAGSRAVLDGVPSELAHAAERLGVLPERVNCETVLCARAGQVRTDLEIVRRSLFSRLDEGETATAQARAALASVPHRLPSVSAVRAAAAELDARALGLFTQCAGDIAACAGALERVNVRLARLHGQVGAEGRRLQTSVSRQLNDHERDYGRATARMVQECATSATRRLRLAREDIFRERSVLSERATRRLNAVRRDLRHLSDVIAARDFRRRGWLLAAQESGAPVRSTMDLRRGQRLALHLHDGRADAVVNGVNPDQRSNPQ